MDENRVIVSEGKTSTEAIENGLKKLNCKLEDVEVKILENEEKRNFFSILDPRVVKVELRLKENKEYKTSNSNVKPEKRTASKEDIEKCKQNVEEFLKEFCEKIEETQYKVEVEENSVGVMISGEGSTKLIGYRGDVINSLQNILLAIGNKNTSSRVRIVLDIGDYREKREKTLKELANKLEKTVKRTGKKITLEPMSAYERKIIHTELQNSKYVTTYSIGDEPRRKVVVDKK